MSSLARSLEIRGAGTFLATALALAAFAANSLLCRAALDPATIDPLSFTTVRLAAGAMALALLGGARPRRRARGAAGSRSSALLLFVYAVSFSLGYVHVSAATGALVLFGAVQLTMIGAGLFSGERPGGPQWTGIAAAAAGLAVLLLPRAGAPSPLGAGLMAVAGAAWGAYSLLGRHERDPLDAVGRSFRHALVLAAVLELVTMAPPTLSLEGLGLAAASGAFASGVGYALWYRALPRLSATRAASVQLLVPVMASAGGALLLGEPLSLSLLVSGALTLGGIGLVLASRAA